MENSEGNSVVSFFRLYEERDSDSEMESGYHSPSECESMPKRHRTNSGKVYRAKNEPITCLQLSSGRILRFHERDGSNILVPRWFESNPYVRRILSRIPFSIERSLNYLNRIRFEEDGYDSEGEMIYYHLRVQVYESYLVELRLRRAMRNVLSRWRIRRMDLTPVERMDPMTLAAPEKEVVLYDWSVKRKFIFDAKSLSILIETALLYHESGFALPMYPRNPWNNLEFQYRHLVSIYYQLQQHGELRWCFTTLRKYNFDKDKWHQHHRSAITMLAIRNSLSTLDTPYSKELLEDFIVSRLESIEPISNDTIQAYRIALLRLPQHWYLEKWKAIAYQHLEAAHFHMNIERFIQRQCVAMQRKQYMFMRELVKLGLIPRIPPRAVV